MHFLSLNILNKYNIFNLTATKILGIMYYTIFTYKSARKFQNCIKLLSKKKKKTGLRKTIESFLVIFSQ